MNRVSAIPGSLGVLAAFSWSWRTWLCSTAGEALGRVLVTSASLLWDSQGPSDPSGSDFWWPLLQTGGAVIVLTHWYEINLILKLLLWLIYSGLYLLPAVANWVVSWCQYCAHRPLCGDWALFLLNGIRT